MAVAEPTAALMAPATPLTATATTVAPTVAPTVALSTSAVASARTRVPALSHDREYRLDQ